MLAVEEELASELNNTTTEEEVILDPTLTMDLTQYNDDENEAATNTTVHDEMELVSPEVKEAHSGPSNMDDGPDRDKITEEETASGEEEDDDGDNNDEDADDLAPAEGAVVDGQDDDEVDITTTPAASTETVSTTASTTTATSTTAAKTTTTTATEAATDESISTPAPSVATSATSSKPTIEYIEPTDDSLDPVANEETENEAFEDGKQKPDIAGATASNEEAMEEWEEEVEEEVKKVGGWLSFVFMILMIYTAYQMSENPDGICASLCRLVITVIGCILKVLLIPVKYIIGGGRPSGGHYMATPDYRDPYTSRHLELT